MIRVFQGLGRPEPDFPMPTDLISGRTVVASTYYIDDERGALALVLLLNAEAPFFTVAHYAISDFDATKAEDEFLREGLSYRAGELDILGRFENIVPAIDSYKDSGGSY